jgi:hypothetical protein
MDRRSFIASLLAAAVIGVSAEEPADARRRSSYRRRSTTRRRSSGYGGGYSIPSGTRGLTDDGGCSCRSGKVCVGPRGGRYCITSGGNKRYGV